MLLSKLSFLYYSLTGSLEECTKIIVFNNFFVKSKNVLVLGRRLTHDSVDLRETWRFVLKPNMLTYLIQKLDNCKTC